MKIAFTFLFLLLLTNITKSQSQRPSIGLTLSGGGAKGLAHIGILQALDSAGLKIDYLTGTSMGSVMGAMYAAGYSGDSIEKIARAIDWKLLFSTKPALNNISIEEKSEYDKYALEVPIEKGKIKIGKGIIEGQELWLKLSDVFQPVYNITDFSKLPIPFKCIGTDLTTGDAVEMDQGNIVTAIRASMAIPSVFTPVRYQDKTLVDGGVVNNFPVQNIKKMGADYVIGVNVSHGLHHADSLNSALDILLQIGFFKDAETFEKHKALCNLYIMPDLKEYATGDFDASDSIIDLGKETGRKYYPYFKKLADSLNAIYPSTPFVKDRVPKDTKIILSRFSITGLNNTSEKFFFGLLNMNPGKEYSTAEIRKAIRRVYGSRYYDIIRYEFIPLDSGKTEMHFEVEESSLSAAKVALNYTNFTRIGLKLNLTTRDLFFRESRALASFELSSNPRMYLEYYHFLTKKRTTRLNLNLYGEAVDYPIYRDFRIYETLRSNYLALEGALQYNLNVSSMIILAQQRIFTRIKTVESPTFTFDGNNNYWYSYLGYAVNNLNKKYFPTRGWFVRADAGYVFGQDPDFSLEYEDQQIESDTVNFNHDNYARLFFRADHYSPLNSKLTFLKRASLAYLIADNPYLLNSFLGGGVNELIRNQVPFVGLDESEIKTSSMTLLQLGIQYNIRGKSYLTGRANVGLYDFHNSGNITMKENFLSGYGLTFGLDSGIGPIELTAMYCDQDGKVRSNIRLGYLF